jgi:DNA-binding SARP family transcriptional activator
MHNSWMRIRLLGPVGAETDGEPIHLGGRKQRAVFALLALQVNNAVALDRLVHELWRDQPPAQATLSLQSYISRLRRTIANAHPVDEHAPRILTRPPGWALVMPDEDVDVVRFAELAQQGTALLEEQQVGSGAAKLREALGLWTGGALEDLDDLPLAASERARLEELRLSVTESLLIADLELGRPTEVLGEARRMVTLHPYRERAWGALMLALYRLGRQAEALDTAQQLRQTLAEGLGIDPTPEVRRIQQRILEQDPTLDLGGKLDAGSRVLTETQAPEPPAPEPPAQAGDHFLGRELASVTLDQMTRAAAQGQGGLLVVDGPAGMGKSAVLDELERRATESGALVLRSGGVAEGAMPALWPWVAVLRQLSDAQPEMTRWAQGDTSHALALLDPSVGVGVGVDAAVSREPTDPVLARTRLYRAVVDLLVKCHHAQRLVVVVDDAHWLDEDTLGLLALVADELLPLGVLLTVALRNDDSPDVTARINGLCSRHRALTRRLPLVGLDSDAVAEIVHRAGGLPDPAVTEALMARTGGNPLFVSELVRLLISERRLDRESIGLALPDEVREVLRRRLDRLPHDTQLVLAFAALVNRPVDVRTLARMTGLDEEAALSGAEAAVASSLLVEGSESRGLVLSHDLVRQTLEESLSGIRSTRMHSRIAEVMQAETSTAASVLPETVLEIAQHLVLAERIVGPEAALPYLVTVADDAIGRAAFKLAERALSTALDLWNRTPGPVRTEAVGAQIRTRLLLLSSTVVAETSTSTGPTTSNTSLGDGSETRVSGGDVVRDPVGWWGAQIVNVAGGRADRAAAAARGGLDPGLPSAYAAVVESVLGLCLFERGDGAAAEEHLARADELGEQASEPGHPSDVWIPTMRVFVPGIRAMVAVLRDDTARTEQQLAEARQRAGGSAPELVFVEYAAAWTAASVGDARAAHRAASACLELGRLLGESYYVPMSQVVLCWARSELGDTDAGLSACEAYAAVEAAGMRFQSPFHLMLCAEAMSRQGHPEEARRLVTRSLVAAQDIGERTLSRRLEQVAGRIDHTG